MKVLLVDDSPNITKMLARVLRSNGSYEIDVAYNGFQALDKMLSFDPTLVMLDLSMPGMPGQDTLSKIMEINPNVKVIISSAHSDNKTKNFCLKNGALGFITKPYTVTTVLDKIKNIFTNSKHGVNENIFLTEINARLVRCFEVIFGKNQHIEFQTVEMKKNPGTQKTSLDVSETIHAYKSEIPILEIPDGQRAFTTELLGQVTGSIIIVVPDKFIEMVDSFPAKDVVIGGSEWLLEFFNMILGAVLSSIGDFLNAQITAKPIRTFDSQRDKAVGNKDLLEINYTFELEKRNTWFTIHLWMNALPDFEKKLDDMSFY